MVLGKHGELQVSSGIPELDVEVRDEDVTAQHAAGFEPMRRMDVDMEVSHFTVLRFDNEVETNQANSIGKAFISRHLRVQLRLAGMEGVWMVAKVL
ncbi:hypothetical protein V6N13_008136 [Hibiscus sabdariffa]